MAVTKTKIKIDPNTPRKHNERGAGRKPGSKKINSTDRINQIKRSTTPPLTKKVDVKSMLENEISETSNIARNNEGDRYESGNTIENRMMQAEIERDKPKQQQQQQSAGSTDNSNYSSSSQSTENNSSQQQQQNSESSSNQQQQEPEHGNPDALTKMMDSMLTKIVAKYGKKKEEDLHLSADQYEALRNYAPPGALVKPSWPAYFIFFFGILGSNFLMAASSKQKDVSINDLLATLQSQGYKIDYPDVPQSTLDELRKRGYKVHKQSDEEKMVEKLRNNGYTVSKVETFEKVEVIPNEKEVAA